MSNLDHNLGPLDGRSITDELDRQLDAALARYANVEPRAGLQDRLLATLRAKRLRSTSWNWWRWPAIAAVAATILIAFTLAPDSRPRIGDQAHNTLPPDSHSREIARGSTQQIPPLTPSLRSMRGNHQLQSLSIPQVEKFQVKSRGLVAPPKLDQFPSPRPLSEQEQILASYVAHFQQQAVLIARINNEEVRREELKIFGRQGTPDANEPDNDQNTNR